MKRLAHQILEDERVIVSFVGQAQSVRVDAAEARRFAWALLADLDPHEADAMGYRPPAPEDRATGKAEREWRPGGWQIREVMEALSLRPLATPQVGLRCGVSTGHASVQLSRLTVRGFVQKLTEGRAYYPSTWTLTDAGRAWLSQGEEQAA